MGIYQTNKYLICESYVALWVQFEKVNKQFYRL